MAIHTFVGPKHDDDWHLNEIRVRTVSGSYTVITRGQSADIDPAELPYLSRRFKLTPGTGAAADPIIDPEKGATGTQGPAGPAGIVWRGAWSVATAYAQNDGVQWAGSSFVALNAIAAGGGNPRANTSNWLMIAQGGGEIAYAENITGQISANIGAATQYDVPGLSINVPASSGAHMVEGLIPMVNIQTNAGVVAGEVVTVQLFLIDEGGLVLARDTWQHIVALATAGKNSWRQMSVGRRMPNNGAQKTYKLTAYLGSNNSGHEQVALWSGPGNQTVNNALTNLDFTPAFIQAKAL